MVEPATVPFPPVDANVPFIVADNVPVTFGEIPAEPRKLYKAGFMLPAMKLAENADCPGAPPVRSVKLAFWKDPVNRFTMPLPKSPVTVIEPPGLKITRLEVAVETEPVAKLIVPLRTLVFGAKRSSCTEVRADDRPKLRGEPDKAQLDPVAVFELNEMVSALAGSEATPNRIANTIMKYPNLLLMTLLLLNANVQNSQPTLLR